MSGSDVVSLEALGWGPRLATLFADHAADGLVPARVVSEQRGRYRLSDGSGELEAVVAGRLRYQSVELGDVPAVGDWVAISAPSDGPAVIHAVLPRSSRFARPARGDIPGAQVVAANVDIVFIVSGLDGDFNLRRIERYLALAWSSGAEPVIVLNKADLCADVVERLADVQSVAPGVPIRSISALTGAGLETITPLIEPGRTMALLGSSGVGKSTIVNALLGWQRQVTGAVRADDQRGRHTTTIRELLVTPSGALLIDSPGMRTVGMWDADEGLSATFGDIDELAAGCRFSDCGHRAEPGCAVRAAIESGSLPAERLSNRRRLERELAALERRRAPAGRAEQRRNGRRLEKFVRSHMRAKYGNQDA